VILVVALNPALDVTYELEQMQVGGTNRVARTTQRAGGKPLNVARILGALGAEVTILGLAAESIPARFDEEAAGLPITAVWVAAETGEAPPARRTITVVDRSSGEVTAFNEPGLAVTSRGWERLRRELRSHLASADAVVLSGSVPSGLPVDAYARLVEDARAARRWVALDTDGQWLGPALAARPDLVKPNAAELERTGLAPVNGPVEARSAARALCHRGVGAAVVSLGARGLVAATASRSWSATVPEVSGNPTGAGDATLAGLVSATVEGLPWTERVRRAAALGAAAVAEPVAGDFRASAYQKLLAATDVTAETG
jgi:tagatose 6-phosphate kinase